MSILQRWMPGVASPRFDESTDGPIEAEDDPKSFFGPPRSPRIIPPASGQGRRLNDGRSRDPLPLTGLVPCRGRSRRPHPSPEDGEARRGRGDAGGPRGTARSPTAGRPGRRAPDGPGPGCRCPRAASQRSRVQSGCSFRNAGKGSRKIPARIVAARTSRTTRASVGGRPPGRPGHRGAWGRPPEVPLDPRVGPAPRPPGQVPPEPAPDQVGEQPGRVRLAHRQGVLGRRHEPQPVRLARRRPAPGPPPGRAAPGSGRCRGGPRPGRRPARGGRGRLRGPPGSPRPPGPRTPAGPPGAGSWFLPSRRGSGSESGGGDRGPAAGREGVAISAPPRAPGGPAPAEVDPVGPAPSVHGPLVGRLGLDPAEGDQLARGPP